MSTNIKLLNYIDLSLEEKKMVLAWRNHPNIQQWMYDTNDIELKDHLFFIELLKKSKSIYFLVQLDNTYIGTINLTNISLQEATLGLYANPELKGYGKALLHTLSEYAFTTLKVKTLIAEVFSENTKAIHLYKKFHFKEHAKKTINNKEVICMELSHENR